MVARQRSRQRPVPRRFTPFLCRRRRGHRVSNPTRAKPVTSGTVAAHAVLAGPHLVRAVPVALACDRRAHRGPHRAVGRDAHGGAACHDPGRGHAVLLSRGAAHPAWCAAGLEGAGRGPDRIRGCRGHDGRGNCRRDYGVSARAGPSRPEAPRAAGTDGSRATSHLVRTGRRHAPAKPHPPRRSLRPLHAAPRSPAPRRRARRVG